MIIPYHQRLAVKEKIAKDCGHTSRCELCETRQIFVDALGDSNIPVKYWFLKYSDFKGSPNIKEATTKYLDNLNDNYLAGKGLCFSGTYGTGKTYSICSILKKSLMTPYVGGSRNYTCFYVSFTDLVSYSMAFQNRDEFASKVMNADIFALDEVDSRHLPSSDEANQLFGAMFEKVIRYRIQNCLPTILATNNSKIEDVFTGQHKRVVESLGSSLEQIIAFGKDHRLKKE